MSDEKEKEESKTENDASKEEPKEGSSGEQKEGSSGNSSDSSEENKSEDEKKEDSSGDNKKSDENSGEVPGNHPGWDVFTQQDFANAVGVRELNGIVGSTKAMMLRQHLLNPNDYKSQFKKPNPGKMPNNQDPFPVDLKIEEFETHYPPTHIHELTVPKSSMVAAMAAMNVGTNADKRLTKIENNLSTLFRLFFRLGTRVPINCVYYGGQTPFEKYKGIRCLCDDRISDGQEIQIDQCLYCTRFEPVYGQCYEIMNDLGANVAAILDDNQMSYSNMEDYIQMERTEKFHTAKTRPTFDLSMVQTRNQEEKDFSTAWGKGIKMKWDYVPLEDQKTHINWRQSINDDGSKLKRLASFPCNEANAGANTVKDSKNAMNNIMIQNRDAMDSYVGGQHPSDQGQDTGGDTHTVALLINNGKNEEGQKDDCLNLYQGATFNEVKQQCTGSNIDALIIACLAYCVGTEDYAAVKNKYMEVSTKLGSSNPALIISAYNTSPEVFLGQQKANTTGNERTDYGRIPRIDLPIEMMDRDTTKEDNLNIYWQNKETLLWPEFAQRFIKRAGMLGYNDGLDLFPKVCYLYCAVYPNCMNSRFDEEAMGFPFFDGQFSTEITYSSPYGPRGSKFHYGIDLVTEKGADIHACHDGTVVEDGTGDAWGDWHGICIDHGDGNYSRYLHCSSMNVSKGQTVSRGDVIGKVGGFTGGQDDACAYHLHLEISPGDAIASKSSKDPVDYFPKFASAVPVGSALKPAGQD